jgi:hypothetical protein
VYDATPATTGPPPTGQLNIWNKSAGAGKTQFQGVGDELFFGNGVDQQKWVLSNLVWKPNMLYDGTATSDEPLGDFIVDPNGFLQQAVGGFTLLISYVSVSGNKPARGPKRRTDRHGGHDGWDAAGRRQLRADRSGGRDGKCDGGRG